MNTQTIEFKVAAELAMVEYFAQCIKNGATPAQAKKEMLSEQGAKAIADAIKNMTA